MAKSSIVYVYGINPCFEALRGQKRDIKRAFLWEDYKKNQRLKKLKDFLDKRGVEIEFVKKDRLFQLSKTKENQGAVLKTSTYKYTPFNEVLNSNKILLLDNVEDPHNVGAILRSAEIFGFHDILLPHKGVPEIYPSVIKTSAGASEHLRIVREMNSISYVKKLVDELKFTLIALDEEGNADLKELAKNPPEKMLLVIGGEGKSVGQFILNASDHIVAIKQFGKINSLNASVAAGIAMYELGGKIEN